MNLRSLADKAKQIVDRRGGSAALKQDARELRDIARGPGIAGDKAKTAAQALREPGGSRAPAAGLRREAVRVAARTQSR
jgi:hypothetical protein